MTDIDDASIASYKESTVILAQQDDHKPVNPNYVLLDSQSTVHLFSNPSHVQNIHQAVKPINIHCNKGTISSTTVGDFANNKVYLHISGIANVLSLHKLGKKYHITYDSQDCGGVFKVHTPKGVVEFISTSKGLHYVDLSTMPKAAYMLVNTSTEDDDEPKEHILHVNTVRDNFEGFTKKQVQQAHCARRLMSMLASPFEQDFQGLVHSHMLPECPVTYKDVKKAHTIFGPDLANIQGKMVQKKPERVITNYVEIPRNLITSNANSHLTADIMFVNGIRFLVLVSCNLNLITIEHAPHCTAAKLGQLLQRIITTYNKAGFHIQTLLMGNEFEKIRDHIHLAHLNMPAAAEHIAEVKRKICVLKECTRGLLCTLPYKKIPQQMLISFLHFVVMWLNNFPVSTGITSKYSPRKLILRH